MPEENKCPQCGTPLPSGALAGLCPACLLKMGAAADTVTDAKGKNFVPPGIAELAAKFPQLEILELIGRGGMGAVYMARQKQLDRIVALKILPPGIGDEPAFAERFAREAKALAKLNHPNIVTLYEFGDAGGQFYFLMEFVDGVNLRQLLAGSRVSAREALAIVPQICDALQFAHDQGIVHRDIKPENILLDRRGRVKVADFGLAKIIENREAATDFPAPGKISENLTDAGKTMGTPNYMSPEQIAAPGEVDHRADIYALGVVFYQMLTGELPGKTIAPPSAKVQIDVRLDEIVLRALEKNPGLRYQQVSEVKTCVETIAGTPDSHQNKETQAGENESVAADAPGDDVDLIGYWFKKLGWKIIMILGVVLVITGANDAVFNFFCGAAIIAYLAWSLLGVRYTKKDGWKFEPEKSHESKPSIGGVPFESKWWADFLRRSTVSPTNSGSHFSRMAMVGVALMLLVFPTVMIWGSIDRQVKTPPGITPTQFFWDVLVMPMLMLVEILAPTILGWAAVSQIRRSAGKIYGMWLAVFDGLLFPLLTLDIFIWFICNVCTHALDPRFSVADARYRFAAFALVIAAIISALIDWLIIRAVWRAVNQPSNGSSTLQATATAEKSEIEKPKSETAERFSRTAIVGAAWLAWFFAVVPAFLWHENRTGEFENAGPFASPLMAFVCFVIILPAFIAPFGVTITGWIAVSQIRRSAGKIYGMGLAVFDGLLFPLLVLDFFIWYLCLISTLMFRNGYDVSSGRIQFAAIALIVSVIVSALADWLIIRAVWRMANPDATNLNPLPAVESWLAIMDNGNYAQSWDAAAKYFKKAIAKEEWVDRLQSVRQPQGKVISRKLRTERQFGSRYTMKFDTAFGGLKAAVETVTFSRERDGQWRAIGYLILPAYADEKRLRSQGRQAMFFSALGGISGAAAFCFWPNPPANLVWGIPVAALLGIFFGIQAREHRLGKRAIAIGCVNLSIWLIILAAVNVAAMKPHPPQTTDVAKVNSPPFVARLNQGEVELLAIGDQPWTNTVCWLANGALSDKPFPIGSGSMDSWADGKVTKKIAFRIHNESSYGISYPVGRDTEDSEVGIVGSGFFSGPTPYDDAHFIQLIVCPTNAQTMNFSLGLANGKWEAAVTLGKGGSASSGDWSATCNVVTGRNDVAVGCTYSKNEDWESRMVYVDDNGKIIPIQENPSRAGNNQVTGATLLVSSNEFVHIKEFQLQRRKYQWVEFRNVSLQSGHLTTVEVKNSGGEKQVAQIAPATPAAAQNLSFGPVIERVINEMSAGTNFFLDLDTGKTFNLPPELKTDSDVANAWNWCATNGIDVRGASASWSFPWGLDLIIDPVPLDYWDNLTQSNLDTFLQRHINNYAFPGTAIGGSTGTDMQQPTYLFKTREGGVGILQITGYTENTRGVKLRYKLVQNGNATGSNPAISPALLNEPPKLRYLEWDEDWKTNYLGGVHYPDGSLVTNKQELAWLEYVSPGMMSDVSGGPNLAKQHPHFLHLWFSHPLFDDSFFAEVTLADENGKNPTDPYSSRVAEIKAADPQNGNIDWLVESLMCGAGTNIPAKVTVRLRYTLGPLEQVQEIPSDYSGYFAILGGSQLDSIGQDARGNTLVTIGVNPETMKTRQYCVEAATKDGRKLMSGGGISGNSDGSGPQVARFYFNAPLADVAKFIIGTRPIRTNEWKNVVLPSN